MIARIAERWNPTTRGHTMFGTLGVPELLFIFALALLIFGPRELPKFGRTIGKAMSEFRKASVELRRTLNTELLEEELRQNDPRQAIQEVADEMKSTLKETTEPSKRGGSAVGSDEDTASSEASDSEKERGGGSGPEGSGPEGSEADASEPQGNQASKPKLQIRAPQGQLARGQLDSDDEEAAEAE